MGDNKERPIRKARVSSTVRHTKMGSVSLNSVSAFNALSLIVILVHLMAGQYVSECVNVVKNPQFAVQTLVVTIAGLTFCGIFVFSWANLPKWQTSSVLKCGGIYVMSTAFIHCLAVLYGAPLIESANETFYFSLLLATAAVLPSCALLGTHADSWLRVFARNSPEIGIESNVHLTTICSIIGAWLGAIPIPLDWDRPWQVWPRSCVLGTLFGYCVGLLLSNIQLVRHHRRLLKHKLT